MPDRLESILRGRTHALRGGLGGHQLRIPLFELLQAAVEAVVLRVADLRTGLVLHVPIGQHDVPMEVLSRSRGGLLVDRIARALA